MRNIENNNIGVRGSLQGIFNSIQMLIRSAKNTKTAPSHVLKFRFFLSTFIPGKCMNIPPMNGQTEKKLVTNQLTG